MPNPYLDAPRVVGGPGSPVQPLCRVGLLGDVHAEDARLEAALAFLDREGVERVLCVGDVADGEGDLDRAMQLLEAHRVLTVRGNHERWFLGDELRSLRHVQMRANHEDAARTMRHWLPFVELATVAGPLLLCHAIGTDDFSFVGPSTRAAEVRELAAWKELQAAGRFRFIAAGHTHTAHVRALDGITLINPGTLKRDDDPCFAVVDFERAEMRLIDLASPARPFERARMPLVVPFE